MKTSILSIRQTLFWAGIILFPILVKANNHKQAAHFYANQIYGDVQEVAATPFYNLQGTPEIFLYIFQDKSSSKLPLEELQIRLDFVNDKNINSLNNQADLDRHYFTILAGAHSNQPPFIGGYQGLPEYVKNKKAILQAVNRSEYRQWKLGRLIYLGFDDIYYELSPPEQQYDSNVSVSDLGIHIHTQEIVDLSHISMKQQDKTLFENQWQRFNMHEEIQPILGQAKSTLGSSDFLLEDRANLAPYYLENANDLMILATGSRPIEDEAVYESIATKIWFGVQNAGKSIVPQDYHISFFINNILVYTYISWFDLDPGQTLLWFFSYTFEYPGQYTIKMEIDPENVVDEFNENDNTYERAITVLPWEIDEEILEDLPGYNQTKNDCGPVSAAKILAYWDEHAYQGQTYWNLVDHGDASTGDLSPIQGDTLLTGLVQSLRTASSWTPAVGTYPENLRNGIEAVCNSPKFDNNLSFDITLHSKPIFDSFKEEILNGRPVIYGVDIYSDYQNHSMSAIGYKQTPLDRIVWVKDNLRGDDLVCLNWIDATNRMITIVPGGTPQDSYEEDNSIETATRIDPDDLHRFRQTHNFYCANDIDCISFHVYPLQHYAITTRSLEKTCNPQMMLIANSDTLFISKSDPDSTSSRIDWFVQLPPDSVAYVIIREANQNYLNTTWICEWCQRLQAIWS